jgi:pimeloyl-ACP methyl ester carboxylesterase
VSLPLDYDAPSGPTTDVAVLRLPARDPARRIGTLFINPGGPGGSGVEVAAAAPFFLGAEVLDRFDIMGFDPRGTNFSDNVKCWANLGAQFDAIEPLLTLPFPFGRPETRAYVRGSENFGRACSTTGRPLSASMSTAEVARDMDVLRRMAGDKQLTYLGFSYGSYLGTVYSNLFPDRVRAVAIDGVIDPVAWAGTTATASVPQTQRLRSGEGAAKALNEILVRCGAAGPDYCQLAAAGDPVETYAEIVAELKAAPVVITDPQTGEVILEITYPVLTSVLLGDLYAPDGSLFVDLDLSWVLSLLEPPAAPGSPAAKKQAAARQGLLAKATTQASKARVAAQEKQRLARAVGWAFPYFNGPEAFQSVLCSDGRNPSRASDWATYVARNEPAAPGFGALWTWNSAPCATSTWTVGDEDTFRGPFTRRTVNPVLVVGNYWDPATNYQGAVTTSKLLPNSRLLSSDSWGHTAYGTSACVTTAVEHYLLTKGVPPAGTTCVGDIQPFTDPIGGAPALRAQGGRQLPPVVPPLPGALPRS